MPPDRYGRYEVQQEIGDGAMGRVYRAFDPVVGRAVAIKTVKTEFLSRSEAPEYLRRFRREAQAAGALSHPAIVSIFDIGDGYLVMEHLEGRTLQALLQEKGRFHPAEALRILGPVADALDHANRQGVIHRDVKPSNIMVLPDGRPKLMDFGVAHLESSVMTNTGQILGSPSYMAPEQVAGLEVTNRTDVYALGVVAYEMMTGQRPFQGSNVTTLIYRIMNEPAPSPRTLNSALPSRYDDVFELALAKDPARRFPSAAALVAALDLKEFEGALNAAMAPAGKSGEPAEATHSTIATAQPPSAGWWLVAVVALAELVAIWWWHSSLPVAAPPVPEPAASAAPASPSPAPVSLPPGSAPSPGAAGQPSPPSAPVASPSASAPRNAATSPRAPRPSPAAVANGEVVERGLGATQPRRLAGKPAAYPEEAKRRKQEGTVVISLIVDESGQPTDLAVARSAGRLLDEAALEAVRSWRFEPATKNGVKVPVRWTVTQRFVLER